MRAVTLMKKPPAPSRPGKTSDPEWRARNIQIRKWVDQAVVRRLYGTGVDFSDLIDELLQDWLAKHG
jgi:hypothetical protein